MAWRLSRAFIIMIDYCLTLSRQYFSHIQRCCPWALAVSVITAKSSTALCWKRKENFLTSKKVYDTEVQFRLTAFKLNGVWKGSSSCYDVIESPINQIWPNLNKKREGHSFTASCSFQFSPQQNISFSTSCQ